MEKLIESVKKITVEELRRANASFEPFNSTHEGYAVALEELDEITDEIGIIKAGMENLWSGVKKNWRNEALNSICIVIKERSILAAAESIQLAAMMDKFINLESEVK